MKYLSSWRNASQLDSFYRTVIINIWSKLVQLVLVVIRLPEVTGLPLVRVLKININKLRICTQWLWTNLVLAYEGKWSRLHLQVSSQKTGGKPFWPCFLDLHSPLILRRRPLTVVSIRRPIWTFTFLYQNLNMYIWN